jgi:hypothetical protein
MRMARCGQRGLEHRQVLGTSIPQENLARICTPKYKIGVERRECDRKDI